MVLFLSVFLNLAHEKMFLNKVYHMKKLLTFLLAATFAVGSQAQDHKLSRDEILAMSTDQLAELPLDQLMEAVETLGVSSVDELFSLIMNKNVSSASKSEENSFSSPLSSTVITRDEMRTYGVTSIEEALRLVPGMIVAEKTNGIYDVQMRGLANIPDNNMLYYTESANLLVMIDGRPSHNYATGTALFESIPISIEDVERIEVVRGATSALYGANAVNGVINIITQKPDNSKSTVQGSFQSGNNSTVADFSLRKKTNDVLAVGLTGNFQLRHRKNGKIYIIPQDGYYVLNDASAFSDGLTLSGEQLQSAVASGKLTDVSKGADLTVQQIDNLYKISSVSDDGYYSFTTASNSNVNVYEDWPNPEISRRTAGINGYVTITPSPDVRFDVQGGFDYALYATTPIGNEDASLRFRKSKLGYANFDARIFGLHVQAGYIGGPVDMALGSRSFSMEKTHNVSAVAEYDIKAGPLNITPGVSYLYAKYVDSKPEYVDYGSGVVETSGYWGYYSKGDNYAEFSDIAPSVRLDYKHGGLRLIGAVRSDKTSLPDKWNTSWQFAASYLINDNNFVRVVYGRSFRSASLVNTSSKYTWPRPTGSTPASMQFMGNEDAPILHIDNVEIGYRLKPTNALLIDAEAFYSRSTDYGALKSSRSDVFLTGASTQNILAGVMNGTVDMSNFASLLLSSLSTKSCLQYEDMPFVVHQFGIGLNVDWIISSKLIAKINANIQRTTIDNYYQYSQAGMIKSQLLQSQAALMDDKLGLNAMVQEVLYSAAASGKGAQYVVDCMGFTPVASAKALYDQLDQEGKEQYLQSLLAAYNGGPAVEGVDRPLGLYYALKYNVRYDREYDEYYLATSVAEPYETEDNYRHKAIPAVYGMAGIIYKPTTQWNIAAFANVVGKREYTTLFGTEKVNPRCTVNFKVGYKPLESCEFFINAHNLFNNQKREFIYTDKIGGSYTVGVIFGI